MSALIAAAFALQQFFEARQWRFCIIGGIALLRWGGPRFTDDVDATLLTGFGREDEFARQILSAGYEARVPDAIAFAQKRRVLLCEAPNGTPIDISFGGLPFEELVIERSSLFEFEPGCWLRTCSAEDLIVQKLFAFRPQDLLDVETVHIRQRGNLDWAYIETQLAPLAELKEQPEIMAEFFKLRRRS